MDIITLTVTLFHLSGYIKIPAVKKHIKIEELENKQTKNMKLKKKQSAVLTGNRVQKSQLDCQYLFCIVY